jgi:hypothetical protein
MTYQDEMRKTAKTILAENGNGRNLNQIVLVLTDLMPTGTPVNIGFCVGPRSLVVVPDDKLEAVRAFLDE